MKTLYAEHKKMYYFLAFNKHPINKSVKMIYHLQFLRLQSRTTEQLIVVLHFYAYADVYNK